MRRLLVSGVWGRGALCCASLVLTFCGGKDRAGGSAASGQVTSPPSFLLLLVDALRPDHLGSYGYSRPTSPVLDDLAADSVVFDNAYAVSSWTKPSVPSLFTSLYPDQHGVFEGSAHGGGHLESDVLPEEAVTLAEALKERGYATAAFVHNAQLRGRFGFAQGFDQYEDSGEDAPLMVGRLLRWLRDDRPADGRPFFAYLHLLDVHWPYEPPAEAARALGLETAAAASRNERALREAVNQGVVTLSSQQVGELVSRYDAEIRFVDGVVGELLAGLKDLDLMEDLVFLITSDHGEAFLEHGALGHGGDLYEESVRVPLIVRLPGREAAARRILSRVSAVDLMPTILDLAGCLEGYAERLEGRSLAKVLRGEAPSSQADPDRASFAEVRHGGKSQQAIWKEGWKLIRSVRGAHPAPSKQADGPVDQALVGRRFEVEGSRLDGGRFVASDIQEEVADDQDDEVSGPLDALDLQRGTARVAGYSVVLERAVIQGADRKPTEAGALKLGVPIKVEGRADGPDWFLADKVRLLSGKFEIEIEGIVRRVFTPSDSKMVEFEIAGLRMLATSQRIRRAIGEAGRGVRVTRSSEPQVKLELYHLGSDPAEKINLVGRSPDRVRSLLRELEAWRKLIATRRLKETRRAPVDEETLRRLRAMGYVQ